jgi:hypothetical protein
MGHFNNDPVTHYIPCADFHMKITIIPFRFHKSQKHFQNIQAILRFGLFTLAGKAGWRGFNSAGFSLVLLFPFIQYMLW